MRLNTPFGIFCSRPKMGLLLMRGLALKKCMAGGKSALITSSCFILKSAASSRCSASVSTIWPPVCMEASCSMRASLCLGSGMDRPPVKQYKSRHATAAWGRCSDTAIFQTVSGADGVTVNMTAVNAITQRKHVPRTESSYLTPAEVKIHPFNLQHQLPQREMTRCLFCSSHYHYVCTCLS